MLVWSAASPECDDSDRIASGLSKWLSRNGGEFQRDASRVAHDVLETLQILVGNEQEVNGNRTSQRKVRGLKYGKRANALGGNGR